MSKMIKVAKVANVVMAGVTVAEGVCASVVVDKALKAVPGNRFVNLVGRSVVTSLINGACAYAAKGFLDMNEILDATEDKHEGYRKLTIVDANGHKIKQWHKPGDLIHVSAHGLHSDESEFVYWYCTKGNVEFGDSNSEVTSFIMPDENVRIEFAVLGHHVHVNDDDPTEPIDPEEDPAEEKVSPKDDIPAPEPEPVKADDNGACDTVSDSKKTGKK